MDLEENPINNEQMERERGTTETVEPREGSTKAQKPIQNAPTPTTRSPNQQPHCNSTMHCILLNTRSLHKNRLETRDTIEINNPDMIFITETWLKDYDQAPTLKEAIPPGYRTLTVNRATKAGGLAIVYKSNLTVSIQETRKQSSFEHLLIKCIIDSHNSCSFLLIYRPPSFKRPPFPGKIADFISTFYNKHPDLIVLGDFNVWLELKKDPTTKLLILNMKALNLNQLVRGKTHTRGHTLDAIFANPNHTSIYDSYPLSWTDHWLIDFRVTLKYPSPTHTQPPTKITTRKWKNLVRPVVDEWFTNHLPPTELLTDPERGSLALDMCIREAVDVFAPPKEIRQKNLKKKGWYCAKIDELKKEQRALERRWRKQKDTTSLAEVKKIRRILKYDTKNRKKEYYTGRILKAKNPTKELYKIIKDFRDPETSKNQITYSQSLCDSISTHFTTKVQKFHDQIQEKTKNKLNKPHLETTETHYHPPPPQARKGLQEFKELSEEEFHKLIKDSSQSGSPEDPCPAHIMKDLLLCSTSLREATRTLINSSLKRGIVPAIRKKTFVKPLLKKKGLDPNNPDNFRAVTNNSYLAKLEEKAAFLQLSEHTEAQGLLDDHQIGFRKGRSTETATTAIWEDLKLNADKNDASALILLDLSAAFDTVDHTTLTNRLEEMGITGTALKWIKSFLSDRTQITWTPPFRSEEKPISYGVPQGASISPLLFNLYLSPLLTIIKNLGIKAYNYADDTQLVVNFKDPEQHPPPRIKECITQINDWMNDNNLVLNPNKTVIMLTGNKNFYPPIFPWPEELGPPPANTDECTNLGILMDHQLLLKKHCSKVARSCFYQTKLLRKILPYLAFPQKVSAAISFIMSRIDFANSIFLGTSRQNLYTLQRAQNLAARLVLNLRPTDHISPALLELHWLPVGRRISFKSLCIAHKAIYAPNTFLANRFRVSTSTRPQRNGGGPLLIVPSFKKSKMGGSAFTRTCSKIWNLLPGKIRSNANHALFKRELKSWLFPKKQEALKGTKTTRISYLPATEERVMRSLDCLQSPSTLIEGLRTSTH